MTRQCWPAILERAKDIVESYDTPVTLRQLFYRLVSSEILPNTRSAYSGLSSRTAEARRAGTFPDLIDETRRIHRETTFGSPKEAFEWLRRIYQRDRTEGQEHTVYLGVEKRGIVRQLQSWFHRYGLPVLALGGYASQSYVDDIRHDIEAQGRPAILIYAGDFDPSGQDIARDFTKRVDAFHHTAHIALTPAQVDEYNLPPLPGKASDTRAARFIERHGKLVQVELDALPPDALRCLYQEAVDRYVDMSMVEASITREEDDLFALTKGHTDR